MLFYLCVSRADRRFSFALPIPVSKKVIQVGGRLESDILLCHPDVGTSAGSVVYTSREILWVPHLQGGERTDLTRTALRIGPYRLRARRPHAGRRSLLVWFLLGIALVITLRVGPNFRRRVSSPHPPHLLLPFRGVAEVGEGPLRFALPRGKGRTLSLHFRLLGPGEDGGLEALLNGKRVSFTAVNRGGERRITLDKESLTRDVNELSFERKGEKVFHDIVRITDVYVMERLTDEARSDDQEIVAAARNYFERRGIVRGNLHRAHHLLEEAMALRRSRREAIPNEWLKFMETVSRAEATLLSFGLARARHAADRGDGIGQMEIFDELYQEFPDPHEALRAEIDAAFEEAGL